MFKAYMSPPMKVTFREDGVLIVNGISEFDFDELSDGQTPPTEDLVRGCYTKLVDAHGAAIPLDVLRKLDLETGLRRALHEALDARPAI
jgi:hypothetical protein